MSEEYPQRDPFRSYRALTAQAPPRRTLPRPSFRTPAVLFVLTLLSTYALHGPRYAASIVGILLAHELGHFAACRRYGIPSTLPYFIPMPLPESPFGTLGAIIAIKGRIPSRRALFDVGVAGPLAGLLVAVPVTLIGLQHSQLVPSEQVGPGTLKLGNSLLFSLLTRISVGDVPTDYELMLSPMAFAGWAGLFITALNLLPVGQLDGGHIVYAMLGARSAVVYKAALLGSVVVTLLTRFPVWLVIGLLAFILARRHPLPADSVTQLDPARKALGFAAMLTFAFAFIPAPIYF